MSRYDGFSMQFIDGHRIDAAENDILYVPRTPRHIGAVYCHGAGGQGGILGQSMQATKGMHALAQGLARSGFHVLDGDLGGQYTFGNDTVAARIEAARQFFISIGCDTKIVLVGASMGNLSQMRFAADHPDRVHCMVGVIPAIDLEEIRANNWNGLKANVEAAWGIDAVTPIPARGLPQGRVAEMTSVPWAAWYSSADTVVDEQDVLDMVTAMAPDSQATRYSTTLDHGDPVLKAAPYKDMVDWVDSIVP